MNRVSTAREPGYLLQIDATNRRTAIKLPAKYLSLTAHEIIWHLHELLIDSCSMQMDHIWSAQMVSTSCGNRATQNTTQLVEV